MMPCGGAAGAGLVWRLVLDCARVQHTSSRVAAQAAWQHNRLFSTPAGFVCYEDDQHPIKEQSIPRPVWECLHQLRAAGHESFLVGGAVRDLLLQCGEPKDYDIVTSAQLKQVKALFNKPRIIGKNFPICQLELQGVKVEISSMHTRPPHKQAWLPAAAAAAGGAAGGSAVIPPDTAEHLLGASVAPGRGRRSSVLPYKPQQQAPSWAAARRANAAARDFTVNALLYDPFSAVLFDYVGGMQDAQQRLLRCVGDAGARFQADPACLLRAVRCAARAGLTIEPSSAAAMQQHAHRVTSLNPQRLTAEVMAMLAYGTAAPSLALLQQTQIMQHVLPLHHDYWQRHSSGGSSSSSSSSTGGSWQQGASQEHAAAAAAGSTQPPAAPAAGAATAGSALGQLLCKLDVPTQQQQQKPLNLRRKAAAAAGQQQQQQQQQQHNLLLRVAAALDQLASVKQPAQAEVVLACITAPLLVERLQEAVAHLQQLQHSTVQQQQQQQQQNMLQHPGWELFGTQQATVAAAGNSVSNNDCLSGLLASQLLQQVQQQQQQPCAAADSVHLHAVQLHSSHSGHVQQGAVAAARAFHSSSSSSSSRQPAAALTSSSAGTMAGLSKLAHQLLQGVEFEQVAQQTAVSIAHKVSSMQNCSDRVLFGATAPEHAADLLAAHVAMCMQQAQAADAARQQQQQQQQQQQRRSFAGQQEQLLRSRLSSSRGVRGVCSSSSSSSASQTNSGDFAWLDYDTVLPRTNKQYKQLMQQQQRQAAAAGSVDYMPSPHELLVAAAALEGPGGCTDGSSSDGDDADESAGSRGWRQQRQQHAEWLVEGDVQLSRQQHMVHHVMMVAGVGFDRLAATVTQLQQVLLRDARRV